MRPDESADDRGSNAVIVMIGAGENATLICKAEASPGEIQFDWWHNGRKVARNKYAPGRKLTLNQVSARHSGTYVCWARNAAGKTLTNKPLVVTVTDQSKSITASKQQQQQPELVNLTGEIVAVVNSRVQLSCSFVPQLSVEWIFNDSPVVNSSK